LRLCKAYIVASNKTHPNFAVICGPQKQMTISISRHCQTTRRHI